MTYELDRRTRRDEDRRTVTADEFFADIFPKLNAKHGTVAAMGMRALDAPPLTVEVSGSSWTIGLAGDRLGLSRETSDPELVVSLKPEQFSDLVQNQNTLNAFLVMRDLAFRGSLDAISIWDSLWIAFLEGWPVAPEQIEFRDRRGALLDLSTSFAPEDDPDDIAHFVRETGFVHLKGWLDPAQMNLISADMDRALSSYVEGDGKSWWATLADGTHTCVRMQEFVEHSPATAQLLSSDRWQYLRSVLAGPNEFQAAPVEGRIIEALYKPLGVVSGVSDVSFHRDCFLGRHAYVCSRMTVGVPLTRTCIENGSLRVVAGSHRIAMPVEIAKTKSYLPIVALHTEVGDLTVHLSCTLHESLPPLVSERRVMYTEFPLVPLGGHVAIDTSVGELRELIHDLVLTDE